MPLGHLPKINSLLQNDAPKNEDKVIYLTKNEIDNLDKILSKSKLIESSILSEVTNEAQSKKESLLDLLIDKKILSKEDLGKAIAKYYDIDYVNLLDNPPEKEDFYKLPYPFRKSYSAIIYKESQNSLNIVTANPSSTAILSKIKTLFPDKKIKISYGFFDHIKSLEEKYKTTLKNRLEDIYKSTGDVVKMFEEIVKEAVLLRASDIHFDPREHVVDLRFRIDGLLNNISEIPKEYHLNILNAVKVQANMKADEHFKPQDGVVLLNMEGEPVDLRISIVPTHDGENIVVRILSEYIFDFSFSNLGLDKKAEELIIRTSKKPFGMILLTGPTGSGKTTTLYSLVRQVNNKDLKITTIEDPVEYKIAGVTQIQVNEVTNLTFAKGLRAVLRQDSDIILVGEIRDAETAEIAVSSALTGHLLFSTFHSNDASTVIPRLLDMKIEPFLLASTLELIIAQRLVRKICDVCKYSYTPNISEIKENHPGFERYLKDTDILYKGKGCENCNNLGYKGRIAIFEIIHISKEIEKIILKNPTSNDIWNIASKQGSTSLLQDGIKKVLQGITALDELARVVQPPEPEEGHTSISQSSS